MDDSVQAGVTLTVFILIALLLAAVGGGIKVTNEVIHECENFGKTELYRTWYSCSKIGAR